MAQPPIDPTMICPSCQRGRGLYNLRKEPAPVVFRHLPDWRSLVARIKPSIRKRRMLKKRLANQSKMQLRTPSDIAQSPQLTAVPSTATINQSTKETEMKESVQTAHPTRPIAEPIAFVQSTEQVANISMHLSNNEIGTNEPGPGTITESDNLSLMDVSEDGSESLQLPAHSSVAQAAANADFQKPCTSKSFYLHEESKSRFIQRSPPTRWHDQEIKNYQSEFDKLVESELIACSNNGAPFTKNSNDCKQDDTMKNF